MSNEDALEMAEGMIKNELGTLDDLPRELANTIANIYYKFALRFLDLAQMQQRGGSLLIIPLQSFH